MTSVAPCPHPMTPATAGRATTTIAATVPATTCPTPAAAGAAPAMSRATANRVRIPRPYPQLRRYLWTSARPPHRPQRPRSSPPLRRRPNRRLNRRLRQPHSQPPARRLRHRLRIPRLRRPVWDDQGGELLRSGQQRRRRRVQRGSGADRRHLSRRHLLACRRPHQLRRLRRPVVVPKELVDFEATPSLPPSGGAAAPRGVELVCGIP